jgi:hypothetical protein
MMSASPATTAKTVVTLLRLGHGKEEIEVPEGATLADLLRLVDATTEHEEILVDGKSLEKCLILRAGMIVSVGRKVESPPPKPTWLETVGMFRDDPLFEESTDEGRAYRESQREGPESARGPEAP